MEPCVQVASEFLSPPRFSAPGIGADPGRGSATLRLTLACLAATIPILTHRIPHALVVMVVMYLITQEDTAATLIGSILAVVGVTVGLGLALLAWEISLDIVWLRLCFLVVFLFGGLFLKRVLTIGALGSAIGLPAPLGAIRPRPWRETPCYGSLAFTSHPSVSTVAFSSC
jgi:hypothetical protein